MALEGVDALNRKLKEFGPKLQQRYIRAALRAGMKPVLDQAKANIPVWVPPEHSSGLHRTYKGRLVSAGFAKRSLRIITTQIKDGAASALLGVRREAYYVLQYIERGTSKYPAHPWLAPSFKARKDQALKAFADKLREGVEKLAKS